MVGGHGRAVLLDGRIRVRWIVERPTVYVFRLGGPSSFDRVPERGEDPDDGEFLEPSVAW